ncbi:MAG TPA: chemotaxis protein CheW [Polyangiaceae bacterium]|nr:chemotaxis protein CheW [Polyangiaceae bacterium]
MNSTRSELQANDTQTEYLTFFIAGVEYAVSLEHVREVIPYDTVTRVPGMPEVVRGVTNLRGAVVPVVDLAIGFRLASIAVGARTCIVLVEARVGASTVPMGLLTEEVGQVLTLSATELLPPPAFGTPIRMEYLLGLAAIGKKFALVLDIQRVLSVDELLGVQQAVEMLPSVAPSAQGA